MSSKLEQAIEYNFKDQKLLTEAVTHRSYSNEHAGDKHNERLEFLGDSILNHCISILLFKAYPAAPEGDLSRMRSFIAGGASLAKQARHLGLGAFLRLGQGEEQTQGRNKESLLANAFEAVLAAIYLDSDFSCVLEWVKKLFQTQIETIHTQMIDPKTLLQDWSQRHLKCLPRYQVEKTIGPEHDRRYIVSVFVNEELRAEGESTSRKSAEQKAAEALFTQILKNQS